jgi:hypothetical protein
MEALVTDSFIKQGSVYLQYRTGQRYRSLLEYSGRLRYRCHTEYFSTSSTGQGYSLQAGQTTDAWLRKVPIRQARHLTLTPGSRRESDPSANTI